MSGYVFENGSIVYKNDEDEIKIKPSFEPQEQLPRRHYPVNANLFYPYVGETDKRRLSDEEFEKQRRFIESLN